MRDPNTAEEWQAAVDVATAMLLIDSARQYGVVTGGPVVNVDRCRALVDEGKRRGYVPLESNVDRAISEIVNASSSSSAGPKSS